MCNMCMYVNIIVGDCDKSRLRITQADLIPEFHVKMFNIAKAI